MAETVTSLLQSKFGDQITGTEDLKGDLAIVIKPAALVEVMTFLKNDSQTAFHMLADLFGMDYLKSQQEHPERFAVVYNLTNIFEKKRLFVKVYLPEEAPRVASLCKVWKAADWFEREAWDLYGIVFEGHPNLIRILCHGDFDGHPMRKDYPSDKYQRLKTAVPSSGL